MGDTYTVTFDGSLYTNGIYFLTLTDSKGKRMVKKLVLAH
jgi:hypothetical protein